MFEGLLAELGLQWAPHKRRGPAQVMEFLGPLMCNVPSMRCIGLTESRETKLLGMIADWTNMRPRSGQAPLRVEPVEMARLLGHLVFASQVVQGGRVAMQAMLSSFKGVVVDWRLCQVRPTAGGEWRKLEVDEGFWRDLEWWESHLVERGCVPMDEPPLGVAVVAVTDASDSAPRPPFPQSPSRYTRDRQDRLPTATELGVPARASGSSGLPDHLITTCPPPTLHRYRITARVYTLTPSRAVQGL